MQKTGSDLHRFVRGLRLHAVSPATAGSRRERRVSATISEVGPSAKDSHRPKYRCIGQRNRRRPVARAYAAYALSPRGTFIPPVLDNSA
jgi:hypothetical protein